MFEKFLNSSATKQRLRRLYVATEEDINRLCREFYIKIITYILIIAAGCSVLIVILYKKNKNTDIVVERDTYGGDEATIELKTVVDNSTVSFEAEVLPFYYEEEDMQEVFDKGFEYISSVYLGDNSSSEMITSELNLVSYIDDLGLNVSWSSDTEEIINSKGEIICDELDKTETVHLTAVLSYEDYSAEKEYIVKVLEKSKTKSQQVVDMLKAYIKDMQLEDNRSRELVIPDNIQGYEISRSRKINQVLAVALIGIVLSILIYAKEKENIRRLEHRRNEVLMMEYPGFVEMLALYMGAGLTIKGSLTRIADNYNNLLAEEIKFTLNEIKSGIPEAEGYFRLGHRLNLPVYMKLMTLLSRNLEKGSRDILDMLNEEETSALQIKKELAKKKGEEASTKLLFPMIVLLGIVMIIVVMPVFLSF